MALLKINSLQRIATNDMHMKVEIEILKQTWVMLQRPSRLQTVRRPRLIQYTPTTPTTHSYPHPPTPPPPHHHQQQQQQQQQLRLAAVYMYIYLRCSTTLQALWKNNLQATLIKVDSHCIRIWFSEPIWFGSCHTMYTVAAQGLMLISAPFYW